MAHNGGRSSGQFWIPDLRADFPYLVLNKAGADFSAGTTNYPSILSANGYPQSTPGTRLLSAFPLPTNTYTGAFIVDWQGEGEVQFDGGGYTVQEGASFVSGSTAFNMKCLGVNGRVKFLFNTPPLSAAFYFQDSNSSNPIRNVRVYRADHESRVLAGGTWNPDFIAEVNVNGLNWGLLRFMDWMRTNNNNQTSWSHRGVSADYSYAASKWIPGLWAGAVSGTNTYTVGLGSSSPVDWTDGEIIQCQFTNANTGAATIQPTGRAAKSLKDNYGNALNAGGVAANALATLVYDSGLNCVLYFSGGITSGVPVEVLIDLCNTVNAHGWWNVPHLAMDDYVTQLTNTIKASLSGSLNAYFEYSNEVWNTIFSQTGIAQNKGNIVLGISADTTRERYGWYGYRFGQIATLVAAAWPGGRYKRVIAVQAAGDTSVTNTYRLQGADLGVVAPNRPVDKCEVAISFATYFYGTVAKQVDADYLDDANLTTLFGWADAYAGAPAATLASLDADIRGGSFSESLDYSRSTRWPAWNTIAASYGKRMNEYEGALAIAAPSVSRLTALGKDTAYTAKITTLFTAYKNSTYAKAITTYHYTEFLKNSQAEFPSQYPMCGGNTWTLRNDDLYDVAYQMRDAIVAFNASSGLVQPSYGSKGKKKRIRGPYSDPLVYEAYIQRSINELRQPQKNPVLAKAIEELAVIVSLDDEDEERLAELASLSKERDALQKLISLEKAKVSAAILRARQASIERRLEDLELEEEEFRDVAMLMVACQ